MSVTVQADVCLPIEFPAAYSLLDEATRATVRSAVLAQSMQNLPALEPIFAQWQSVPLVVTDTGFAPEANITALLQPMLAQYNQTRKIAAPTAYEPALGGPGDSDVRYRIVNGYVVCSHARWLMQSSNGTPTAKRWTIEVSTVNPPIVASFVLQVAYAWPPQP